MPANRRREGKRGSLRAGTGDQRKHVIHVERAVHQNKWCRFCWQWQFSTGRRRTESVAASDPGFAGRERNIKKSGGLLCEEPEIKRFEYIRANCQLYRVSILCKALRVSRSGYYSWLKRPESKRRKENQRISDKVREIFFKSHQIYGSRNITAELSAQEKPVNRKRIARLMKEQGLRSKVCRKYKATTNSKHNLPVAENLLNREFTATSPNQKWVSDITYIPTDEGWLYLAGILDLHGRELVGWAMDSRMKKELVMDAFHQAIGRRGHPKGVLIHSDRGSQYCSNEYQQLLRQHDFVCSMSRKGNCWDNAPMESFWGKLKQEWLNDKHFHTRDEAKAAVFYYIEVFYNRQRRHSVNSYLSPSDYVTKTAANF